MELAGAARYRREALRVSLLAQTNQTPYNSHMPELKPLVAVIMGSKSDWDTMRRAVEMLDELGVPTRRAFSPRIEHRTRPLNSRGMEPRAGCASSSLAQAARHIWLE